jgi:predicted negative regulator of RcsB-dependent stress response
MEFLHASIALLASMVLILTGMVGWIYWPQTRMFQNMNAIALVISDLNQTLMSTIHNLLMLNLQQFLNPLRLFKKWRFQKTMKMTVFLYHKM